MIGRFKEVLAKKEIDEDKKYVEFEKNDFLAIFIALGSIMFPVLLLIFFAIALVVWIIF